MVRWEVNIFSPKFLNFTVPQFYSSFFTFFSPFFTYFFWTSFDKNFQKTLEIYSHYNIPFPLVVSIIVIVIYMDYELLPVNLTKNLLVFANLNFVSHSDY